MFLEYRHINVNYGLWIVWVNYLMIKDSAQLTTGTKKPYALSMGLVRQIPPQPRQRRDPRRVDEHRANNHQPPDTKPRPKPPFQVRAHVRSEVALDDRVPVDITGRLVA